MASDAGTRHGAQRRSAEAVGWQVWDASIWTALHSRSGNGEQLQEREYMTTKYTDWGGRIEGEHEKIQKTGWDRWGGRVIIKCVSSNRS